MLEEIRIRGLGVIDDAALPLSPGLTVVTGETGAGKTMVVQGVSLLFGGRADAGRVRAGADKAVVEGRLQVPPDHPAVTRCLDAGGDVEEGVLILSRSVGTDGRSRASVGGRAAPVGVLAEIGEEVLALHGQSDQQRLLRPSRQREALDRFGGPELLDLRDLFASTWTRWRDVRSTVAELVAAREERRREADLLRLGLAEVEAASPAPGEGVGLQAEIDRLGHAEELRTAAAGAQSALTGDESSEGVDALQLVTGARRALEGAAVHDPALAALADRAREVGVLLADLAQDLASYAADVDADPARLSVAQERLAVLTTLVRRHGLGDADEVLAWAQSAGERLLALDGADDRLAALEAEDAELASRLAALATDLSAARVEAAARFGAAVTVELAALAMPHARVTASVTQRDAEHGLPVGGRGLHAGPHGVDEVELLLVPHPGAPGRPLQKGASGGELSRVMLAVEVVFAGADPVPVMVFDEVDAGVGGAAAVEVGRRLAALSGTHQVLVVTHLPQVAAFADQHLLVVKADDGTVTTTGVVALDEAGRIAELSRMMAGLDSGLARAHAEELLSAAAEAKAADAPV